ncbi:MAG: hypothetical protein COB15_06235 [Flavobacteriales bacterium]|nr:MAG: hypothetical protein COB15_06235 [Flavobacteriales bacterium]
MGNGWSTVILENNLGYMPVQMTQLRQADCGLSNVALTQALKADAVIDALSYEFLIENNSLGINEIIARPNKTIKFSHATSTIAYNTAYNISARAITTAGTGSWGAACQVTTGTHPQTQLQIADCGSVGVPFNQALKADKITNATSYNFKVENQSLGFSETVSRPNRSFKFTHLTGMVEYNTSYSISVQTISGSSTSAFGTVCQVSTETHPLTQLQTTDCGISELAFDQVLKADKINNASSYHFKVAIPSLNFSETVIRPNKKFKLSHMAADPLFSTTYEISVQTVVGGSTSSFGPVCQLTTEEAMVEWIDLFGAEVLTGTNTLQSTTDNNWMGSQALSAQVLKPNQDGYIEYIADPLQVRKIIGFVASPGALPFSHTAIDYGIYHQQFNDFMVWEGTSIVANTNPVVGGDVMRIERVGNMVNYYKNGILEHASPCTITGPWYVCATFYHPTSLGIKYTDIKTSITRKRVHAKPVITHADQINPKGSIKLNSGGGSGSYTYLWSTGSTNKNLNNKNPGVYSVTITDGDGETITETITIYKKTNVVWADLLGVDLSNDGSTLTAIVGYKQWNVAKAKTSNYLAPGVDGEFEVVLQDALTQNMIGFVSGGGTLLNDLSNTYAFGFYTTKNGEIFATENGTNTLINNGGGNYVSGTKIRLSRIGNTVTYYINEIAVRQVQITAPTDNWHLAANFNNHWPSESFIDVKASFQTERIVLNAQVNHINAVTSAGTIDLTVSGGAAPYTFQWSNASTTEDIAGLVAGNYVVNVSDDLGETASLTVNVYATEHPLWVDLMNAQVEGNNQEKIRSIGAVLGWTQTSARASNYLDPGQDGEFQYTVGDNTTIKMLGFVPENTAFPSTSLNFLHAFYPYDNKVVYAREGNTNVQIFKNLAVGDVLKMTRIGSSLNYYVNDVLMRTIAVSPAQRWVLQANFYNKQYNEYFNDVVLSFSDKKLSADYITTDITTLGGTGTIDLSPLGGTPPYTFVWSTGATSEDVSNLIAGNTSVSITDAAANSINLDIPIYHKEDATWTNPIGMVISGTNDDIITSNITTQGYEVSQGQSAAYLDPGEDGEFTYTPPLDGAHRIVGFAKGSVAYPIAINDWQYAFNLSTKVYCRENSNSSPVQLNSDNLQAGDSYKISRIGNTLSYYRNGMLVRQLTVTPTERWYLFVSHNNNISGAETKAASTSFRGDPVVTTWTYAHLQEHLDGSFYRTNSENLYVYYEEKYVNGSLTYRIKNQSNVAVVDNMNLNLPKTYGKNWFKIDLQPFSLTANDYYVLEVENEKGRTQKLRFKLQNP